LSKIHPRKDKINFQAQHHIKAFLSFYLVLAYPFGIFGLSFYQIQKYFYCNNKSNLFETKKEKHDNFVILSSVNQSIELSE